MLLTAYTYKLLNANVNWNYCWYIGSATLALYAIHRVIGIDKVGRFSDEGRFAIIKQHSNHLQIYVVISGLAALYFLWHLPYYLWIWLLIPIVISLLYVLPIFPGYRRLRDFPYIKIFLIAIVWVWLTVIIPIIENSTMELSLGLFIFIKFLFLIAITIPFDIRDIDVDRSTGVPTLVAFMGMAKAKGFAIVLMLLYTVGIILFIQWGDLNAIFLVTEIIVTLITLGLIWKSKPSQPDYYYSFFLDGTMGLFWLIFSLLNYLQFMI